MLLQIAGASLFGILLSKYDPVTCLKFAAGLMVLSLPFTVTSPLFTFFWGGPCFLSFFLFFRILKISVIFQFLKFKFPILR